MVNLDNWLILFFHNLWLINITYGLVSEFNWESMVSRILCTLFKHTF